MLTLAKKYIVNDKNKRLLSRYQSKLIIELKKFWKTMRLGSISLKLRMKNL